MLIGHQKQSNFLKKKLERNLLSHAYLFVGPDEIGKKKFAFGFAKLINSDEYGTRLIDQERHPDVLLIQPKDSSEIKILQIREAQKFLSLKPYYSSSKILIVDQAEKMNQEAQSCFLKTLEEPKGKTILILITSKPEILLPTILSRCQIIKFFPVSSADIKKYLIEQKVPLEKAEMLISISTGKPGRAIKLLADPEQIEREKQMIDKVSEFFCSDIAARFQYVKNLPDNNVTDTIEALEKYFRRLLFLKVGIDKFPGLDYLPVPEKLKEYSLAKIKNVINLAESIGSRVLTTNVNPKLALEVLLMEI